MLQQPKLGIALSSTVGLRPLAVHDNYPGCVFRQPGMEVEEDRSDIAAPETTRRPRGLPRVSYRVWVVSTDRSRDGKGW